MQTNLCCLQINHQTFETQRGRVAGTKLGVWPLYIPLKIFLKMLQYNYLSLDDSVLELSSLEVTEDAVD